MLVHKRLVHMLAWLTVCAVSNAHLIITKRSQTRSIAIQSDYNILVCEPNSQTCKISAKIEYHGDITEDKHYHFQLSGEHEDIYGTVYITDLNYQYDSNFEYFTFDPEVSFNWYKSASQCNEETFYTLISTKFPNTYANKLQESGSGTFKFTRTNVPNVKPTADDACARFSIKPTGTIDSVYKIFKLKPRFWLVVEIGSCKIRTHYNSLQIKKEGNCDEVDIAFNFQELDETISPIYVAGKANSLKVKTVNTPTGNPSLCEYGWVQVTGNAETTGNLYVNQNCIHLKLKYGVWYTGDPSFELTHPGSHVPDNFNENREIDLSQILKCSSFTVGPYELKQGDKCRLRLDTNLIIKNHKVMSKPPDKVVLKGLKIDQVKGHYYTTEAAEGKVQFTCATIPTGKCKFVQGLVVSQMPTITFGEDWFNMDDGFNEHHIDLRVMKVCESCVVDWRIETNVGGTFSASNEIKLNKPDKIIHDKNKEIDGDLTGNSDWWSKFLNQLKSVITAFFHHLLYWFKNWYSWLILIILIACVVAMWIYLPKRCTKWKIFLTIATFIIHILIVGLI